MRETRFVSLVGEKHRCESDGPGKQARQEEEYVRFLPSFLLASRQWSFLSFDERERDGSREKEVERRKEEGSVPCYCVLVSCLVLSCSVLSCSVLSVLSSRLLRGWVVGLNGTRTLKGAG